MLQGDVYTGMAGNRVSTLPSVTSPGPQIVDVTIPLSGGYMQSVWEHVFSAGSDTTLQISFDQYRRHEQLSEERKTIDIDFQHHIVWGTRQDVVWGANYRNTDSDTDGTLRFSLRPADVNMQLFSMFVQDKIALIADTLYLTVGCRLDHNYYTGFNALPGTRLAWTPSPRHMFWAAFSRAQRTPSERDAGSRINFDGFTGPGGVPALAGQVGNPHFDDEGLMAYEAGYRTTVLEHLSLDVAAYYGDYDHQQTSEPAPPFFEASPAPSHLFVPFIYENLMHGEAHGFEISMNWKATEHWTLSPGYAFEQIHMHLDPSSHDVDSALEAEGGSPTHSAQLRSHVDFARGFSWDAAAYFVDRLRRGEIPAYTRLDTGVTWRWTEHLSSTVVGQNLVKDRHLEFIDDTGSVLSTLIKRSAYAKVIWQF